jgi:O-phosphoseryl-tRNA synthetase
VKKATSKYYAPQTEFEIFVEHPKTNEWIEIGDGGFYSPVSLSQYDIPYPVFNIGFGVERICMIKTEIEDIRKLVYPYFYEDIAFSDEEISKSIKYKHFPLTESGIEIKTAIIEEAIKNKDEKSPIEIKVWEGTIKDKNIEVYIWEKDDNVKLLGPATLNKVWIKDGGIVGLSPDKAIEGSVDTGKTYLEGIASEMAYNVEIMLDQDKEEYAHRVKMCYRAAEVNIEVDDIVLEFIHSKQKKIDIRGPVFLGLSFKVIN